jgi:hypothetical protein
MAVGCLDHPDLRTIINSNATQVPSTLSTVCTDLDAVVIGRFHVVLCAVVGRDTVVGGKKMMKEKRVAAM